MIDVDPGATARALDPEALKQAAPAAIARAAKEMHEPSLGEFQGLPALERLAAEVGAWPETVQDPEWCARFLFQVIERRGTGGGNFRLMYSRFLEEAGREESALAAEAARLWTSLAGAARAVSEEDEADSAHWSALTAEAERVLEAERRLWDALAPAA